MGINMVSKKELQLAYRLAIVLLVVGVICYAAFPAKAPDPPARIMLDNMAGKILFDHKAHTSVSAYGLSCIDCHHTDADTNPHPEACGECHKAESAEKEGKMVIKRQDAFHQQCEACHKDYDIGPVKEDDRCGWCHAL
jgi:hypothetical protein